MADGIDGPSPSELGLTEKDLGIKHAESAVSPEVIAKLKEIDASITDRHIYSKFKGDVVLHGETLATDRHRALYQFLPSDGNYERSLPAQFEALSELVTNGLSSPFPTSLEKQLAKGHVFSLFDDENIPEFGTMNLIYPVEGVDNADRPIHTLNVFLRMPTARLEELVKIIARNPDALEEFYQIAASGLDGSVERRKSAQVIGINLMKFMPSEMFQDLRGNLVRSIIANKAKLDTNNGFRIFEYSKPQGQVDKEVKPVKTIPIEPVPVSVSHSEPISEPRLEPAKPVIPEKPRSQDNPSGLYPDAPLTKLINIGMRAFRRQGKS